jgi:hypothetical protein
LRKERRARLLGHGKVGDAEVLDRRLDPGEIGLVLGIEDSAVGIIAGPPTNGVG